jgi:hypothetical protein
VISWLRSRAARAALLLLAAPALAAGASREAWRVSVRGQDATRAADPRIEGGVLTVDAAALGPTLPLLVRAAGRAARVRDSTGLEWQGADGDGRLTAAGRALQLDRPLRIDGPSVRLPAAAVAELAGLALVLDPDGRTAAFLDRAGPAPSAPRGWQALVLPKPPAPGGAAQPSSHPRPDVFLPPDHDTLQLGLGLGAVPGADGGGDLTATGSVRGIDTALALLTTTGPQGFQIQNGHAALTDPGRGIGVEGGDLFSGIWGLTQGARFRWRRGDGEAGSWPAVSVYEGDPTGGNPRTVVSYADEIGIGRWSLLGGELASDGSWLADGRVRRDRYSLYGYLRNASGPFGATRGAGLSGSAGLPWGMDLQGSWSRGDAAGLRLGERRLSLRVPLRAADLTLTAESAGTGRARQRTGSVEGATALGRLLLRGRWERRETTLAGLLSGGSPRFAERDLFAAASFLAGSRLRIETQAVERRSGAGVRERWGQLGAALSLWRGSTVEILATSSTSGFGNSFRVRLDQEIRPGFSLFVEAGDVVTFQPVTGAPDRARLRLMVRRTWDVATPPTGTAVEGVVATSGALSPAGLPVALGPYRTVTGDDGGFRFPNVPPGEYDLALREQALPAGAVAGPPARVSVGRGESRRADLSAVAAGEAHGWVYVDRNGNHRRDPGEGIAGAVLVLDDRATATAPDGSFGFYNLPPGTHRLRIETDHLPPGLQAQIPTRVDLGLPAGRSIDGLEFRLQERSKPVVFQEAKR